jgi:hypothetical protein
VKCELEPSVCAIIVEIPREWLEWHTLLPR